MCRVVRTPAEARGWLDPLALAGWADGIDWRGSACAGLDVDEPEADDAPPDQGPVDFDAPPAGANRKSKESEKTL